MKPSLYALIVCTKFYFPIFSLRLSCSEVFYFESTLRSDHFGSLHGLRDLEIEACKLRSLPPRSFVGLTGLASLVITTNNNNDDGGNSLVTSLDIDYEAFVGLERVERLSLARNNIGRVPANLLCPLVSLDELDLSHNQLTDVEDVGLSNRTFATAVGGGGNGGSSSSTTTTKCGGKSSG